MKDDNDNLLFHSKAAEKYMPEANKSVAISDIKPFIKKLKDKGIYLVARMVVFKSPKYAKVIKIGLCIIKIVAKFILIEMEYIE